MYKNYRYINAGENEFYRWGKTAQEKVASYLTPNASGFYSIPADGGKYWTFGTSEGKFGEFAKYGDTFFSVNKSGMLWAKIGTDKAEKFVEMLTRLINDMQTKKLAGFDEEEEERKADAYNARFENALNY